jgi:hypothetical protein
MTDSMTDSLTAEGTLALVNDKMQRNYRYRRTGTAGRNFAPDFIAGPTPGQMLAPSAIGRRIPDQWHRRITCRWDCPRQALAAGQNTAHIISVSMPASPYPYGAPDAAALGDSRKL